MLVLCISESFHGQEISELPAAAASCTAGKEMSLWHQAKREKMLTANITTISSLLLNADASY